MSPRNLDPARHARAADVFLAAVDLSPEEQRSFLGRECASDRELLEMVEQLLAEDRNGSILPEPKPAASPSRESLSGLTLSHYRILEPAGEGGMGTVYRAIDTRLDRMVALKFQPPQILRDAASRERFWREAKTIASIDHPNVCPVYDMEEDGAFLFIAMAYLDGIPLDRRMASGRVSIDEALKIAIQTGRGLEAAHAKGIVHRDIKPANLMLTPTASGEYLVRILDFGIAQSLREPAGTQDELTMGTVCYMAPEQIRTGRVDARADIWSLGVVLYEMLSGRLPFERGSVHETLRAMADPTAADFSVLRPEVPSSLAAVLARMLDKDVASRYQSARELVADLERAVAAPTQAPEGSHPWVTAKNALLVLLVFVIAVSVGAISTWVAQSGRGTLSLAKKSAATAGQSGAGGARNAAARTDYLRGRFFWNKRTLEGLKKSIEYYRQALALDPDYADAYAAMGDAYVLLSSYGGPEPSQSLKLARENAIRALQLNPKLGEAHTVLAAVKVDLDSDWAGAVEEYKQAIRLNPEYPTAHHWYALHLSRLGRHAEAESEIQKALQLDPLSLIIQTDAAEIFYRAGDLARATTYLEKTIELDPDFADAHMIWGEVDEQKKDLVGAIKEFAIAERLFHGSPNIVALEGHAFALAGQRERALKIAHDLEDLTKRRYVSGVDIGIVYCGLGDSRAAMKWLERAYEDRDKGLNIIAADPLFKSCRADRRFTALLSRLHLPLINVVGSKQNY